ncbi:MAG TPA: hypothetical protein VF339_14165 [Gammaproteobacteria bacterium]
MHNRLQRALARRERVRRTRDYAWTVFAAALAAAVFGWILLIDHVVSDTRTAWWIVLVYAVFALVGSALAFRAFGAAMRLARQVDAHPLESADDAADRPVSVWDEIWGRHRG